MAICPTSLEYQALKHYFSKYIGRKGTAFVGSLFVFYIFCVATREQSDCYSLFSVINFQVITFVYVRHSTFIGTLMVVLLLVFLFRLYDNIMIFVVIIWGKWVDKSVGDL